MGGHIRIVTIILLVNCAPVCQSEKCPGLFDWRNNCCDNLGCFDNDDPFFWLPLPCCPEGDEVTFMLYTRNTSNDPQVIQVGEQLLSSFSAARPSVFIAHGWMESGYDEYVMKMKDALLLKADYNVIAVDWSHGAGNYVYPQSASNTRTVGALTAAVMDQLVTEGGAYYNDIWCIGHSLGAHMCAHAGNRTQHRIGRITGLDPAGPWFEHEESIHVGLNPSSAIFVDVIHTDTKSGVIRLGTVRPLGHMDFYPNGLGKQPGCLDRKRKQRTLRIQANGLDLVGCSHVRSHKLFIESIKEDCFVSKQKCTDVYNMPESCTSCEAENGTFGIMGYNAPQSGNPGIYYLETRDGFYPPYCLQ